jgi:hypothetical protein
VGKKQTFFTLYHHSRFPPQWEAVVHANPPRYRVLGEAERSVLKSIQVFLEEKQWEGWGKVYLQLKAPPEYPAGPDLGGMGSTTL